MNFEMDTNIAIEPVWRCTSSHWSCTLGVHNCASLEMHLEAVINGIWRDIWKPWSSELRDALRDPDQASLEMDWAALFEQGWRYTLEAVMVQDGMSIWRQSTDGLPGFGTLLIRELPCGSASVTKRFHIWAQLASWLMSVDHIGRHACTWSYIPESLCNHENEEKTNSLGCQLNAVYGCTRWQWMIMAWRDRGGWLNIVFCNDGGDVDENERDGERRWEGCGGYEWRRDNRSTLCLIWLWTPCISVIPCLIRTRTCHIRDRKLSRTQYSHKSQCLMIFCRISSHLSPCCPQLYCHLRTQS